jgi:hypothetical protein
MKFKLAYLLLIPLFVTIGCVPMRRNIEPQQTVLEKRAIQTREYDTKDFKMVMKAAINVLQDEGFMLTNTELELGLITAKNHLNMARTNIFSISFTRSTYRNNKTDTYNKTQVVECNIQTSQRGEKTRVRVTFQKITLNNNGAITNVEHVKNATFYQNFFMKMDKGIFIEKEGV